MQLMIPSEGQNTVRQVWLSKATAIFTVVESNCSLQSNTFHTRLLFPFSNRACHLVSLQNVKKYLPVTKCCLAFTVQTSLIRGPPDFVDLCQNARRGRLKILDKCYKFVIKVFSQTIC